jgi:putative transposase
MPFVRIMIHSVWNTKSRYPFLVNGNKEIIIDHIKENAIKKQIYIDRLNGYHEHLHCLFGLKADISLSKTLQLLKGESSFWINRNLMSNFEWGDEYFAVGVADSDINRVRAYIDNQEEHHRKISFQEEYEDFIKRHDLNSQG